MASCMGMIGSVVVVVIAALLHSTAAQTTHVVGDSTGWRIPPSNGAQFYASWASTQSFKDGDTLTFNFNPSVHDVAQVTKANFDSCGTSNTIGPIIRTSPANITLNTTGEHYYICTVGGHCAAGQKVAINVASSSTSTPSGSPSAAPAPAPTAGGAPTPSSASTAAGFGVAGVFVAVLTAFFL